jgi:hypothetical protein
MGDPGKLREKLHARRLRQAGHSVRFIRSALDVSKSSVSRWTRDIKLSEEQINHLYANRKSGGLKGSYIASQKKIAQREESINILRKQGIKDVGVLSKRDRFIAGVALYFGEGDKTDKSVGFTNGNTQSVVFMVKWLNEFCSIPNNRIKAKLHLHDNLDENGAKQYWSQLLDIPTDQFTKSYIVPNNKKRLRKSILPHGVIRIVVYDISLHRKIMGWISGVFKL